MASAELTGILRAISGTLGNFTFRSTRDGVIISERPVARQTPPTAEQIRVRGLFSTASKQWQTLTDTQREGWETYAATYFQNDSTGRALKGQSVYIKAAWYAQALDAPLPASPPTAAPPPSPTAILGLGVPNEATLSFRVTHPLSTLTGYRLLVEITPPLTSPARHPQPSDFRAVRGVGSGSMLSLLPASNPYSITGARFSIPNGSRYGCRATIVNPQSIPGESFDMVITQSVA